MGRFGEMRADVFWSGCWTLDTQAYSVFPSPKHLKDPECLGTVWNHGPWWWWNHRSSRYWLIVCISATFSNNDPTYWNTIPDPCWRPNARCPFFAVAAAAIGPEGVDIFIHIIQYLSMKMGENRWKWMKMGENRWKHVKIWIIEQFNSNQLKLLIA